VNNEGLRKAFGITEKLFRHKDGRQQAIWEFLLKVPDEQLATAFRHFMHEQFSSHTARNNSDEAFIMRKMAEVLIPAEIEETEAAFHVKANTRQNNADKKIAALQEKVNELKAAKTKAKKATGKKPSAAETPYKKDPATGIEYLQIPGGKISKDAMENFNTILESRK
ncbi:MAG TPA: hypothetical protein VGM31_14385, partial [Puia sp.]